MRHREPEQVISSTIQVVQTSPTTEMRISGTVLENQPCTA